MNNTSNSISAISEVEERKNKINELKKIGLNPYPSKAKRTHEIFEVIKNFSVLEKSKKNVFLCGRLRSKRAHGNLSFANLEDASGNIQIAISKKEVGADNYRLFKKLIDIGDFLEISGNCFLTRKGEKSIMVRSFRLLSKSIRPLPDKWHGLKNEEEKFRKRYLDLLMNPELREMFRKKAKFWEVTRNFMKTKGFFEVETPTLETTTGGAEANPFKTHHKDFDLNVYLRISVGELWQKRLMSAGFEKTFEIGRAYRNEGSGHEHIQEFTNMEFYWAYANYEDGMNLVRELYQTIAKEVFGTCEFKTRGHKFSLSGEWTKIDYREEVIRQTGIDILRAAKKEIEEKLKELKVKYDGKTQERLIDTLWKYCRKSISGPAFLINHPKIVSPLAKAREDNSELTERFHVLIAGAEIGNGYSELNNPIDQRERFEEQKKLLEAGDEEAMMPDWEFVEMLEYGMPPTCGFGFGERLFAFLVDKPIREVSLFPLVKPKINQFTGDANLN